MKIKSILLTIAIFIITKVQCDPKEIGCLQYRLGNSQIDSIQKYFPKLESSPRILHKKNSGIVAVIKIPYVNNEMSPVTFNIEIFGFEKTCYITPKWLKKEIVDYETVVPDNGKIVIGLKIKPIGIEKYYWELFILDPVFCVHKSKKITTVSKNQELFIRSLKLRPLKTNFNILAEITNDLRSPKSKLALIHSYDIIDNGIHQETKLMKVNLRRASKEIIRFDKNIKKYYIIQNTNNSSKLWPIEYATLSKIPYEFDEKEIINTDFNALSTDYKHVTFCYVPNNEMNKPTKSLKCNMFETDTGYKFAEVSVALYRPLPKIIVKNIDERNCLLIWIEPNGNEFNVFAQIIEGDKLRKYQKLLNTERTIDYITYKQEDDGHCLYIALRGSNDFSIVSYCFLVNFECDDHYTLA